MTEQKATNGHTQPALFTPLQIRGLTFPNRIFVSPMCQYSCEDGFANEWHFVHLGSRAVGGAALTIVEATAVEKIGMISPNDLGLWKDEHIAPLKRVTDFVHGQNKLIGIQLGHAGRKASTSRPWEGHTSVPNENGGWDVVGPSAIPYSKVLKTPRALETSEVKEIVNKFAEAAKRAVTAGFDVIELHGAHGYLIHSFYSPESNKRTDEYGGSFENRTRFLREIATAVRGVIPESMPLFVRLSCTDFVEPNGWTVDDTVTLSKQLKKLGVDFIDCSGGYNVETQKVDYHPGYQVPFAERVRKEVDGMLSGAVGGISEPKQANDIIESGKADVVLMAKEFLRDPYFPIHAAKALGVKPTWPNQYGYVFRREEQ